MTVHVMYICIILSNTLTACLSKYAGIGVWINYYFTKCWKKMNKNFKTWFVVVSEEWGNREDCLKIYCLRKTKHFHLSSSSKLQKACYIVYLPLSLDKVLSPALRLNKIEFFTQECVVLLILIETDQWF